MLNRKVTASRFLKITIVISISGIVFSGCMTASRNMPWEDPAYAQDIPATTPETREGLPGWKGWIPHHERRKQWVSEKPIDLLMIGDSILFEYRRSASKIWGEFYGERNAANISSSGDTTQHMLWHFLNGGLDGMADHNPKVVVLLLGTNNRGEPEKEGHDTALGVLALLKEIHARLPASKIVLMALLPRGWEPDDTGRLRNIQVNEIIKDYADNETVYWLDVGDTFLNADGSLNRELIKDSVHPSTPKGYQALSEAMEPMISRLLGE